MKKTSPLTAVLFAAGSLAFGSAQAQTRPIAENKKASLIPEPAESIK